MSAHKLGPGIVFEDDWYAVQALDDDTFAIGEPGYYQQNWTYLLCGTERALLFDTGSFAGDITGVVARRHETPLTAFPSHMHFDHLGNVTKFDRVAIADLDILRACAQGDVLVPTEDLFLGAWEKRQAPRISVGDWLAPGTAIDLGGRTVEIVHTPGHSPDSVSLLEPGRDRVYAADFLYSGDLYAQVPGASLPDYLQTARALLARVGADTVFACAHDDVEEGGVHSAPLLGRGDLEALVTTLEDIRETCGDWPDSEEWRVPVAGTMGILISPEAAAPWRPAA